MKVQRPDDLPGGHADGIVDFVQWLCSDVQLASASDSLDSEEFSEIPTHRPRDSAATGADELPLSFGRYQVVEVLGKGATAYVYRGWDDELRRSVAIKSPRLPLLDGEDARQQFMAEARRVAKLDHPRVVKVLDCGVTDRGQPYVVSELIEGDTLARALAARGALPWRDAVTLAAETADALEHIHQRGLVHRDVKPQNLLLDADGHAMLADLGIARADEEASTRLELAGTRAYLSPEQARFRSGAVDGRADIFSLGTVLYEMLTGRRPFAASDHGQLLDQICNLDPKPPRQYDGQIPAAVERICLKCLAKIPSDRYTAAGDVAQSLRKALHAERRRTVTRLAVAMAAGVCGLAIAYMALRPAAAPLRVVRLDVTHFDRSGPRPRNAGAVDAPEAAPVRYGDSIRVEAEIDRPGHVALVTLDADGGVAWQTMASAGDAAASANFAYPAGSRVYTLNDAEGMQGLLLLASSRELVPSKEWIAEIKKRWRSAPAHGVWKFDGRNFKLVGDGTRGQEESLDALPPPFSDVCQWSATLPGVDAVGALAFPIVAKEPP